MKISVCLLSLGVFLFVSALAVPACINQIGRSTVSEPIYIDELGPEEFLDALTTHEGKAFWLRTLAELKLPGGRYSSAEERETNTAVAMLHLGMVRQAISILESLERKNPGRYYTAANLGTAYELNGENAKALRWIQEGINRNPDAHNGSEWLHVKILEAKLKLETDPNWLASNSVIELHNVTQEKLRSREPVASGNRGRPIDLEEVEKALVYQLHERLEFIKPPEGVVADLLFDLSRTLAFTRGEPYSATIAAFAQTYGPDQTPWPNSGPFLPAIDVPPPASMTAYWIAGGSALVVAFAVGIVALMRRRKKNALLPM